MDGDAVTPAPDISGTVRDQSGDPVADATVVGTTYNYNDFSGTPEEINESIAKIRKRLRNPIPDAFDRDRNLAGADGYFNSVDGTYAAVHQSSDWEFVNGLDTAIAPGRNNQYVDETGLTLDDPDIVVPADETPIISLWETSGTGLLQDYVDSDLPGQTTSGSVTIQHLGADGSVIWNRTRETQDLVEIWQAANLGSFDNGVPNQKIHEGVPIPQASPGFYRVYPEDQPSKAIVFAVAPNGDVNQLKSRIVTELKTEKNTLTDRVQYLLDKQGEQKLDVVRTTTDADGEFTLDTSADKVVLAAMKKPNELDVDPANVTSQDIRSYFDNRITRLAANNLSADTLSPDNLRGDSGCAEAFQEIGPSYVQDGTTTVSAPASNVTVDTRLLNAPTDAEPINKACREVGKQSNLFNESLGSLTDGLFYPFSNFTDRLPDEDIIEDGEDVAEKVRNNAETCAETVVDLAETNEDVSLDSIAVDECSAGADGLPEDVDGDGLIGEDDDGDGGLPTGNITETGEDAVDRAEDIAESGERAVDNVGDTIDVDVPDTGTDIDETNNSGLVSATFEFDASLSLQTEATVTIVPSDGPPVVLTEDSEYVSFFTTPFGPDEVRLRDYPLGNDTAVVDVTASIVTEDGNAEAETTIRNPLFDGELPELDALRVSSTQPGPDDRVVVEPQASSATFGELVDAQAVGPDGTNITTNITDAGEVQFTTAGAGQHQIWLRLSNAAGKNFSTDLTVMAGERAIDRPPTLRVRDGPLGTYALASDGLRSGAVGTGAGGTTATMAAILRDGDSVPPRIHVHEQSLDLRPSHLTTVRVLRGPDERTVDQRSTVVLHSSGVTEDAIVYVNERPLPRDGRNEYGATNYSAGGLNVEAITAADGAARIRIINNPGIIDRVYYTARTNIPFLFTASGDLSRSGIGLGLSAGLLTTAGAAWLVGRRVGGGAA